MQPRASGILLHPSSLPSRGGIGDFGPAAYEFLDFLMAARQSLWQVLPLGPTGLGNSPYSSLSAFAGNSLLVSLERLAERGWLDKTRLASLSGGSDAVDYERVRAVKVPLLEEAARNFLEHARDPHRSRFEHFKQHSQWWLNDFVLFEVLRNRYQEKSWNEWPQELARRDEGALQKVRQESGLQLETGRVIQFFFFEQWRALRMACRQRQLRVVGDIAIFVSYDSADVWTHPDLFQLKEDLQPEVVAGVPPDYFSKTGQRWGNPIYRWDLMKQRGYQWWMQRLRWTLEACDLIRLDHFRGFEKHWEIPAHEETAIHGRWAEGPGDDFFRAVANSLGMLPLIAEDLGFITPEVHALRERWEIPGMRVLQFGFSDPGAHTHLPHRYEANAVVYTGTHDNDTLRGWWENAATAKEREAVKAYVGAADGDISWALIRCAESSVARLAIVPLQDVLGLDSEARMNVPSRPEGNWSWRYAPEMLKAETAQRMAELMEVTDRAPEARLAPGGEPQEDLSA